MKSGTYLFLRNPKNEQKFDLPSQRRRVKNHSSKNPHPSQQSFLGKSRYKRVFVIRITYYTWLSFENVLVETSYEQEKRKV